MLKIKDNVDLEKLKDYGFKLEPEKSYYYKEAKDAEIFIWKTKDDFYKKKYIYLELKEHGLIVDDFDKLFDLIQAGLVEKVEDRNE